MAAAISETVLHVIIGFFFVFGTASTMTSKLLFQFEGEGLHGIRHKFEKPLFQSTMMFLGMSMCMFVYWFSKPKVTRTSANNEKAPLLPLNKSPAAVQSPKTDYRVYYVVAVPALCDFLATYMMTIGLLWVNASIFQMVRGSIVLFSALIRWGWLGKRIYLYQWFGVLIVMIGEVMVGYSAIAAQSTGENAATTTQTTDLGGGITMQVTAPISNSYKLLGIALIFGAQLVQALQVVVEEHLLHNIQASAYLVVGLEGVWGMVLCCCISAPLAAYLQIPGLHEDTRDTLAMFHNDPVPLIPVAIAYTLTILGFNLTAMKITEHINSVTRCVLDTVRTIFIWILMTIAHYYVDRKYGEEWTSWCYLELAGFAMLMFGLFTYYQVIALPFMFEYPTENAQKEDRDLATPLLTPKQRQVARERGLSPAITPHRKPASLFKSGPTNLYTQPIHPNGNGLDDDDFDSDDDGQPPIALAAVSSPRI